MIGTDAHGHTFPGATTPFGMVQLSPDTGIEGWDWCSGYHYSDSSIMGFSHTHLSGTGGADLGDILVMPFLGDHKWEPGTKENPDLGYRSRFSHQREFAQAGYYSVMLDDYNIAAELTATPRTGIHRYRYAQSEPSSLIIDLKHGISNQPREASFASMATTRWLAFVARRAGQLINTSISWPASQRLSLLTPLWWMVKSLTMRTLLKVKK
nr:hypothetical protein [Geofilum rubicundum]